ncbi:MAG: hypothetical protein JWO56_3325 [Acidobacteria bacterium]|nr:hypothetical protein [Acidobacteriota bacterium]
MIGIMKRLAASALFALAAVACSSSNPGDAKLIKPEISFEQIVGPAELGYPGGRIDIQYEVTIANRSAEPISLRRIEVSSIGGGAYRLRRESFPFSVTVPPDRQGTLRFWAHALQSGAVFRGSNEPVTLRAILFFDSPAGKFQQIVMRELGQFEGGSPR